MWGVPRDTVRDDFNLLAWTTSGGKMAVIVKSACTVDRLQSWCTLK